MQAIKQIAKSQPMYNLTVAVAHTYFVGNSQLLVHNDCPIPLPNRQGVGKTTGVLTDSDGNVIGDNLIQSGRTKYSFDSSLVRGDNKPYYFQDHVEAQVSGMMRDLEISDATLWLNNHPCRDCNNFLPKMLPENTTLRIVVSEGLDIRGVFDQTYIGTK